MCILLIIGNIPFVSMVVVLIRQSMFRKRMSEVVKHSRTMQRLVQDIEHNRQTDQSSASSSNSLRQRQNAERDRKSTRLNSSHMSISYAVFCLKKKKKMRAAVYDH